MLLILLNKTDFSFVTSEAMFEEICWLKWNDCKINILLTKWSEEITFCKKEVKKLTVSLLIEKLMDFKIVILFCRITSKGIIALFLTSFYSTSNWELFFFISITYTNSNNEHKYYVREIIPCSVHCQKYCFLKHRPSSFFRPFWSSTKRYLFYPTNTFRIVPFRRQ